VELPALGIYKPPDVRAILKAYEGKNIPLEYAKKEAAHKQAFIEEWKARGGGMVRLSTPDFMSAANCLVGFEQRRLHCQLSLLQQNREGQHPQHRPTALNSPVHPSIQTYF
jgi:hypothetical protein